MGIFPFLGSLAKHQESYCLNTNSFGQRAAAPEKNTTRLVSIVSKPIKVVVVVVVIVFAKKILIKNNPCPKTFRPKSVGSKKN